MTTQRPQPVPTVLSEPFWTACGNGQLTFQRCERCGFSTFPPQEFCRTCGADKLNWVESSGFGSIYSYSTVWRPATAAFDAPYIVIIAELDEGWRMVSNLQEAGTDEVRVGMRIQVDWFRESADAMALPVFVPSRA